MLGGVKIEKRIRDGERFFGVEIARTCVANVEVGPESEGGVEGSVESAFVICYPVVAQVCHVKAAGRDDAVGLAARIFHGGDSSGRQKT